MSIHLASIIPISNPSEFKVHLAKWNGEIHPLDDFVRSRHEWDNWNRWRPDKDRFNRPYIFSLIDFYPQPGNWLFGGTYRVLARKPQKSDYSYEVERVLDHEEFVGRLKILFTRPSRNDAISLEKYFTQMVVSELLPERYTGEAFPGYEKINHDFNTLEAIFSAQRQDWKAALENVKGVYLIADKSNGKKYVGAAYGGSGVWGRWRCYLGTGHGETDELTQLIKREGIGYAIKNLRLTLLESLQATTDVKVIQKRENYWKEALLTREPFGYNKN